MENQLCYLHDYGETNTRVCVDAKMVRKANGVIITSKLKDIRHVNTLFTAVQSVAVNLSQVVVVMFESSFVGKLWRRMLTHQF